MPKVNKTYPSFYNGVSQQSSELILDNQCRDMVNCIPDLVLGLSKRPPVRYSTSSGSYLASAKIFHTYDRGEDNEEYIFLQTNVYNDPIHIYNKAGTAMTFTGITTAIKNYLNSGNLKALTVQDTTYVVNKNTTVTLTNESSAPYSNYNKIAYYWLKRSAGDKYNPYNYAVYLDGTTYACNPNKPSGADQDPPTGFEDSDYAANYLAGLINASANFNAEVKGSLIKIWKDGYADFTFDSWDSWGNQASEGWKGSVNKLSDLPNDWSFGTDTYVEIKGNDNNDFTNYYVKWDGSSWLETRHPGEIRGTLTNMPVKIERTAINTFTVSQITFDMSKVGDLDSNPDPTFVGQKIQDIFFYKNRLGFASQDNVVLSQTGDYYDFYIKTVLDVLDDDPIDIAIASTQASQIYFVIPFQNSLFIFTKDSQFQMTSEGYTSPKTVSITSVSNYPMSTLVQPKVINNSLFFISTTNNRQQLREYIKDENSLTVKGIDLNITTPTYLEQTITSISVNGVLGYVLLGTANNIVYMYSYKDSGSQRVQSAWCKWELLPGLVYTAGSFEYHILDSTFIVVCKTTTPSTRYIYHTIELTKTDTDFRDLGYNTTYYPFTSSILLPQWYPKGNHQLGTPKDKMLLKKVSIQGSGDFSASIYRKDYDYTYTKAYDDTSMKDLDLHIASRVDNCDISISSSTNKDFSLTSVVMEGFYKPTSQRII